MPRARVILQSEFPYHITARCINREWFHLPMDEVWSIFCSELKEVVTTHRLEIHSFVLMTNHFHLIARTPEANISTAMQQFMHRTSLRLARAGNRMNETFTNRHYKSIIGTYWHLINAYKYVYRNPVQAGLCTRVEDSPYSTLQFQLAPSLAAFPVVEDEIVRTAQMETVEWLNREIAKENLEAMRKGIRFSKFRVPKNKATRQPVIAWETRI